MEGHEHPEWGEVFDALGGFGEEPAFYVTEAERSGGPVLEIGCGTGRILLPTAARGVESWGIDRSRAALDRLALKAERQGLMVTTHQADMRDFRLPRRFALITVPNRTFLYMTSTQEQIASLENFRHHLAPGGRLVLNFFHPTYRLLAGDDFERREHPALTLPESGRVVQWAESVRRDLVNQLAHVIFHFQETEAERETGGEADGATRGQNEARQARARDEATGSPHPSVSSSLPLLRFDVRFTLRWVFKAEFALLLRAAGFERWQVCGGFNNEPLERDDQEMVWTAWAG